VQEVCDIMGADLPWAEGLPLRADGYETPFYMKD
jgi:DNA polymerase